MPFAAMLEVSDEDRLTILTEFLQEDYDLFLRSFSPSMIALLFEWMDDQGDDDPVKVNRTAHMATQTLAMFLVALAPDDTNLRKSYRKKAIAQFTKVYDYQMAMQEDTKDFVMKCQEEGFQYLEGLGAEELKADMADLKRAIHSLRRDDSA